jgi:hypothetical protein
MMEEQIDGRNIQIGESNKLDGDTNYHIWKVKIKVIFKRGFVENN